MIRELSHSGYAGDRIVEQNMALNIDIRAYHAYSFETVRESDSGRPLHDFVDLPVPKLFLHGDRNQSLTYLPRLRARDVTVSEIPDAAHFLLYDNPVATYQALGDFLARCDP